jgi:M6 family metalloprotease-like protein
MKLRILSLLLILVLGYLLPTQAQFLEDTVDVCATDPEQFTGPDMIGELRNTTWTLKVLLVEFTDVKHRNPQNHGLPAYTFEDWNNMLFSEGVYVSPNMVCPDGKKVYGSMRDYYAKMSDGEFTLTGYVVNRDDDHDGIPDWISVANTKLYYANSGLGTFNGPAKQAAQAAGLDISTPGNATKLVIVYAGNTYRGSKPNGQPGWNGLNPNALGKEYIMGERYKQGVPYTNEHPDAIFSGIGIHAHEFGHLLGWPDTYGNTWELMNGGLFMPLVGGDNKATTAPMPPNPELRHRRGWLSYTPITSDVRFSADYNLKDPEVFQVKDSSNPDRYFLIECRHARGRMFIGQTETWDYNHWAPWDFFNTRPDLPDIWLMVWVYKKNPPVPIYATLVQADGFNNATTGYNSYNAQGDETSFGDSGDIFPGFNNVWLFSPWSFPQALDSRHAPSSRPSTNVGMEIVQLYNNYILVDLYYINPANASPGQPRFLEATASGLYQPVELNWEANTEPDMISGGKYKIYRASNYSPTPSASGYSLIATINAYSGGNPVTSYTDNETFAYPSSWWVHYKIKARDNTGKESTYSNIASYNAVLYKTATDKEPVIREYSLEQNYPNPFNPETAIRFTLPEKSKVVLTVYNIAGEHVATLVNGEMAEGYHQVSFNASRLASGIYLYRIQAGKFIQTRKMMLLK